MSGIRLHDTVSGCNDYQHTRAKDHLTSGSAMLVNGLPLLHRTRAQPVYCRRPLVVSQSSSLVLVQ